jgi:hypothetical protein
MTPEFDEKWIARTVGVLLSSATSRSKSARTRFAEFEPSQKGQIEMLKATAATIDERSPGNSFGTA